jgi:hypothetical protein|tara:strand:+ start:694 stop:1113 length:420 start_codon:yes stop_codon:yes gene_type:complete
MDTLGKFKTNFLKDRSSFNVGFNNRSPLSNLKGGLDGSIKSASSISIPKLNPTIGKDGSSILVPDNSGQIEAAFEIGSAIGQAGEKIGKAIEEKQFNKIVDNLPEHYDNWKKENPDKTTEDYNKKFSKHIDAFKETRGL